MRESPDSRSVLPWVRGRGGGERSGVRAGSVRNRWLLLVTGSLVLALVAARAWIGGSVVPVALPETAGGKTLDARGGDASRGPSGASRDRAVVATDTRSVEPGPGGDDAWADEGERGVPSPAAGAELDRLAETFLGEEPDYAGALRFLHDLALEVEVQSETVFHDPRTGMVEGEFRSDVNGMGGEFRITGDRYKVTLQSPAGELREKGLLLRTVSLGFRAPSGRAEDYAATIQFHVDTSRGGAPDLAPGEEMRVGWVVAMGREEPELLPLSARRDETTGGWIVGHSEQLAPLPLGHSDPTAHDAWLRLLEPHANPR